MRKVLFISYYYPPSGGPGVQRGLKFTRYLPAEGWRPLVLTVREDAAFPARDESLNAEIPPEAIVYRSPIWEFYDLYRRVTGRSGAGPIDIETVQREGESLRERWVRAIRGAIFIPDGRVGWMPGGLRVGRRIGREEKPEVIFATGPPFTAHWLGATLARELDLPLVLDFRDPWTRANFYPRRPRWARRIDERLERSCLREAARIVTVNEQIREELRESVPELASERFLVIPNGFDPVDFTGLQRRPATRWTIAHVGSIFASRVPYTLLDVLEQWLREEPGRAGEIQLRLVGRVCPEMLERVGQEPLSRIVLRDGYRSHRESVQTMIDADLLLLLTNEETHDPGMITGKLFEYLGSGRPILALTLPGEASRILEETNAGYAIPPKDAAAIRALLQKLHGERLRSYREMEERARLQSRGREGESVGGVEPGADPDRDPARGAVARYSRPVQARRLAEALDEVINEA